MHPGVALTAVVSQVALSVVLVLAALVTVPVAGLALAAYVRRRSQSYLLVALAGGALVARTGVAVATVSGFVPTHLHHVAEHALDAAMAALVIAAVYYARSVERGDVA